jgi:hypothetical protein
VTAGEVDERASDGIAVCAVATALGPSFHAIPYERITATSANRGLHVDQSAITWLFDRLWLGGDIDACVRDAGILLGSSADVHFHHSLRWFISSNRKRTGEAIAEPLRRPLRRTTMSESFIASASDRLRHTLSNDIDDI